MWSSNLIGHPVFLFAKSVKSRWRGAGHFLNKIQSPVCQSGFHQRSRTFSDLEGGSHHRAVTLYSVGAGGAICVGCCPCIQCELEASTGQRDPEVGMESCCEREQVQTGTCVCLLLPPISMQQWPTGEPGAVHRELRAHVAPQDSGKLSEIWWELRLWAGCLRQWDRGQQQHAWVASPPGDIQRIKQWWLFHLCLCNLEQNVVVGQCQPRTTRERNSGK